MADVVTQENAPAFRKTFALSVGHTEDCIEETVTDMAGLLSKVCVTYEAPIDEIIEQIGVERFDTHLRKILEQKECDCFKRTS